MAITKLNLTGGNAPFDPADPRTFPTGFSDFEDSVQTELDSVTGDVTVQDDGVSQGDAGTLNFTGGTVTVTSGVATVPLNTSSSQVTVIHQLDDRSWSDDVPSRAAGDPRIELRGWDDPADATNGVDTPANLDDLDVWLDLGEYGIAEPWAV